MLDGVFELICFGLLVGRHARIGKPARRIHLLAVLGIRLERCGGTALLAAQLIVTGVGHGPHEPGFERTTAEGIDTLESGNKSILGGIRGKIVIAEDAKGGIEHTVLVMQDKRIKGVQIAFLRVLIRLVRSWD